MKRKNAPKEKIAAANIILWIVFITDFVLFVVAIIIGIYFNWWLLLAVGIIYVGELIYYNVRFNKNAKTAYAYTLVTMNRFNQQATLKREEKIVEKKDDDKAWVSFKEKYNVSTQVEPEFKVFENKNYVDFQIYDNETTTNENAIFFSEPVSETELTNFKTDAKFIFANNKCYTRKKMLQQKKAIDPNVDFDAFLQGIFKDATILNGQWPYLHSVLTRKNEEIPVLSDPAFINRALEDGDVKRVLAILPPEINSDQPTWNVLAIYGETLTETETKTFKR